MKRHISLLLLCCAALLSATAQVTVTGVVFEPNGETAIGATVIEKGYPASGTATDIDGRFSIKVTSPKATLVISYIGMETREVALNGKKEIQITLTEDRKLLDDVVIVGFGTQKKVNATGAVKTIDSKVLEARPLTNAVAGLQGAVAGLNITNDQGGGLGQEMQINIRGIGSIGEGSNSSPLVLIDGMEGDLATLNPNDIENVSVLKDAAAASIYGSRAPFGVILVTTKSGKKEFHVNYTGNARFAQPVKVPDMVDAKTYCLMINDAWVNAGGSAQFGNWQLERIDQWNKGEIDYCTEDDGSNHWKVNQQCWGDTDWYEVYLKDFTFSHEHNLSVTGGGKLLGYYFSANYMEQTGLYNYADEKFQRLSGNGKLNFNFNKYVNLTWNIRYNWNNNSKPSALNDLFYHNLGRRSPLAPVTLPNGEYSPESLIPAMMDGGRVNNGKRQLYNQLNLVVTPVENWKIHLEGSYRYENNPYSRTFNQLVQTLPDGVSQEYFLVLEGVSDKHSINVDNGNFVVQPSAGEKYREDATNTVRYFNTNLYTDYKLDINKRHHFTFLLGEQSEYYWFETNRFATYTTTKAVGDPESDPVTMESWKSGEWASLGFFGRINYNFDERYLLEVNLRADGASRFPSNQRWGFFPSFSLGWNIANEPFFQKAHEAGFEYLKLRASYGTLGNQNTSSFYPYFQKMSTTLADVVLGGTQATKLPVYNAYSASLTWEKIENIGAGIDWGFFKNRFTGAFDIYQRTTKDMVGPAKALPAVYGTSAPKTNNAELRTRGWEFEIGWRDHPTKNFSYGISGQVSDYETIITKYDSPDNNINGWYEGKKYGDIWGYEVIGIAQSDAEMYAYLAEHKQTSLGDKWGGGDIMYKDLNNDGKVDSGSNTLDDHGDLKLIGNSTPRYAYSFTLDARYRWIDVRAFFQGIGSRDVYFKGSATFFGVVKPWQRTIFTEHEDYFRYAGSQLGANFDSYYGRIRIDGNNQHVCDRYLQNAGYLRLKNVQIGFNLPENTALSKVISRARLYLSGENLFTWTNLRIYDPEAVGSTDSEWGPGKTYPQYRTYSIGLELTF